jgi:hypothetical protein
MADPTSEAIWQEQVIQLAHTLGWEHMHCRRSIGPTKSGRKWLTATNVAWPDLTLWAPGRGLMLAELKTDIGKVGADQETVLSSLRAAGVPAVVWRPRDLDEAVRVLSRRSAA